MRRSRPGDPARLAGPGRADPSPVWPDGAGLTVLRPLLGLRRNRLRAYLRGLEDVWLDDPSNEDPTFERVRIRRQAWPAGSAEEQDLLACSDAAALARASNGVAARSLLEQAVILTAWGGARLDAELSAAADPAIAVLALETLILAVSGKAEPPAPDQTRALLTALTDRKAATLGGALLTLDGWIGRDPGAAMGRSDGAPGAAPIDLQPGQTAIFDGRWRITAHQPLALRTLGAQRKCEEAGAAPAKLRPGLAALCDPQTGQLLALPGVNTGFAAHCDLLVRQRIEARLLSPTAPAWFDSDECVRVIEAGLAKANAASNIDA